MHGAGRYVAVGFNGDPESGNTGRPLRKVSMGNFSVLGVMMGYNDMPVEFRRSDSTRSRLRWDRRCTPRCSSW